VTGRAWAGAALMIVPAVALGALSALPGFAWAFWAALGWVAALTWAAALTLHGLSREGPQIPNDHAAGPAGPATTGGTDHG